MIKTLKTMLAVAAIAGSMSIALAQNVAAQSYGQGHHNSYSPPDPAEQNNGASGA